MALGQHRVDEGAAQVEPPARGFQHPLDQLVDLLAGQHQPGQLVAAVPGDEDPARVVDPQLLDLRVVEVGLERPETAHPRQQLGDHSGRVGQRSDPPGQRPLVVRADQALGELADAIGVALRVDALAAYLLAQCLLEVAPSRVTRRIGRGVARGAHALTGRQGRHHQLRPEKWSWSVSSTVGSGSPTHQRGESICGEAVSSRQSAGP